MNEFGPKLSPLENKAERAVAKLHEIADNEQYAEYASGEGPLTIAQLPFDVRVSTELKDVIQFFGWPDLDDELIEPVHEYESAEVFVEALRDEGKPYLNNLNSIFAAQPTRTFVAMKDLYGVKPPLNRAYVVAPDLFEAIRGLYRAFPRIQGAEALTDLMREDPVVAEQLMKAFCILARLIKTTDLDTEMKLIAPKESAPLVTSAQTYLTT